MRTRIRGILLFVCFFLAPSLGLAQTDIPPVLFTGPLSGPRPETGGLYTWFNFVYMKTNRPLASQEIAYRGFLDLVGDISGGPPATFVGSREVALETNQL